MHIVGQESNLVKNYLKIRLLLIINYFFFDKNNFIIEFQDTCMSNLQSAKDDAEFYL